MGSKWKNIPLGDLVSLQRGHDLPSQHRIEGAVPIMGSSGLTGWHNTAKTHGPGVVIGRSGNSMGEVSYCDSDFWPLNTCLYVTDFKGNDVRYIYYLLQTINFDQFNSGSAQKSLNRNAVYPFEMFATTNKNEQSAIGKLLSDFEEKIFLNTQINQTLEQMAQTLFKSWFVDFDPVIDNALDAGSPIPEVFETRVEFRKAVRESADFKPLPDDVRQLFPSEFEDSELGWVPKGWSFTKFGDLLDKTIGGDWGKDVPDEKHTEQVKIIRGTDIPDLNAGGTSSAPTRWVESKKLKTRKLEHADIVIEVSGGSPKQPTGRSLLITHEVLSRLGGVVEPASFCRRFKPVNEKVGLLASEHLKFIYTAGKMWEYQNQSTGIANFQTKFFLEAEYVLVPNAEVLEHFFAFVMSWIEKRQSSTSIELEKLRDTLLPKLISGELRLDSPEVEQAKALVE
ncbi:Type I restriction-modification system, specificity subunit S [Vibrio chagasii]|nr:Type I restriction-modification system, specificity subunit S [Vibrio chagasii]CAH6944879.1 Type I restriction-modification system, specificity subunit S [Vibrio chagasii]CAH7090900.1 Type I restriction-modification system, specificity subunit S [Vibrio chagasii]CAH7485593.1 Type I restriction-modification system, specificity subunit S [Vibrio chagasii]